MKIQISHLTLPSHQEASSVFYDNVEEEESHCYFAFPYYFQIIDPPLSLSSSWKMLPCNYSIFSKTSRAIIYCPQGPRCIRSYFFSPFCFSVSTLILSVSSMFGILLSYSSSAWDHWLSFEFWNQLHIKITTIWTYLLHRTSPMTLLLPLGPLHLSL